MVKGRRTRQANSSSQQLHNNAYIAASSVVDDTASPKRKDFKYDANYTTNGQPSTVVDSAAPMMLRGGRTKTAGIVKYLTNLEKSSAVANNNAVDTNLHCFIDLTDDSTRDSFDVTSETDKKATSNIFLQEPVLTLNFDKTASEKSRVIIRNCLLESTMQGHFSPPNCENPIWTATISDAVVPITKENNEIALDLTKPTQVTSIDSTTFLSQDSCDSGDSGVVILHNGGSDTPSQDGKRRKPATPHRILCPSPVKIPIVASPSTALANLNLHNKRASRKNLKSKRRLHNSKELENALEEAVSAPGITVVTSAPDKEAMEKKKSVLNDSVNPSAQQNTNNNQTTKSDAPIVAASVAKSSEVGTLKKMTDYFQVRRSVRKTKKEVQWERDCDIEKAIREEREEGLAVAHFDGKGRGVITTRPFMKGEFVIEYVGDLITVAEAKQREQMYAEDDSTGCYMYYFKHRNMQHCIDATAESGKLGRLVNHSRNGNLMTKTVCLNNRPHLVLIAKDDIAQGVEVTYDYGDRSKEALQHHPWLAF